MSLNPMHRLELTRGRTAVVVSVALHGIVIYLFAQESWFEQATAPRMMATLVFVEPPEPSPRPDEPVAVSEPEPIVPPDPSFDREEADEPAEPSRAAARDAPAASEASENTDADGASEPDASVAAEPQANAASDDAPPIDWDEAGRTAVEAYLARQTHEEGLVTFSGNDIFGDQPEREGRAGKSVFDSDLPLRAALRPNRSRSALVRKVGRLCEGLTGGVSLFGLVALCTDAYGRRDIFDPIRPDYLDELPECAQVTLSAEAQVAAIDAGLSTTPIKCRMVPRDERYPDPDD
jgi:hypothetical protein